MEDFPKNIHFGGFNSLLRRNHLSFASLFPVLQLSTLPSVMVSFCYFEAAEGFVDHIEASEEKKSKEKESKEKKSKEEEGKNPTQAGHQVNNGPLLKLLELWMRKCGHI